MNKGLSTKLSVLIKSSFIVFYGFIQISDVYAQNQLDTLLAYQYYSLADSLSKSQKYDSAIHYYQKALPIYETTEFWERNIECKNKISINYRLSGNFKKAFDSGRDALETGIEKLGSMHSYQAEAYLNMAIAQREMGDYVLASEYSLKAIAIQRETFGEKHPELAKSYDNVGIIFGEKGDYDITLDYFLKSLEIKKEVLGETDRLVSDSYNNLGILFRFKGNYFLSIEYFQKAMAIRKEILGEKHVIISGSLNNIGIVYKDIGNYTLALQNHFEALEIRQEVFGEMHPLTGDSYNNIGSVYDEMDNDSLALIYFKKALNIRIHVFGEKHPFVAESYNNIGILYHSLNKYSQALAHYQKALIIQKEVFSEKHPNVALSYENIGSVYHDQGIFNSALDYYQRSLIANVIDFNDQNWRSLPSLKEFLDSNQLLKSLQKKAAVLREMYLKNGEVKDLETSLNTYKLSDDLIGKIRNLRKTQNDKLELGKIASIVYEGAIQTCLDLFHIANDKKYLREAFYFSEKSKASVLKESMAELSAKSFNHLSDSLLSIEQRLKVDRSFYESEILNAKTQRSGYDTLKINEFNNRLFTLNRIFDSLSQMIEENYPEYYKLKYENEVQSATDIQQSLADDNAIIEYFLGDSSAYVFLATKEGLIVGNLNNSKSITEEITDFRKSILIKDIKAYKQASNNLYNQIFAPIAEKVQGKELIIIPHGALWHVNFDLLLSEQIESEDYRNLPYLVKDFSISYGNAAHLLFDNTFNSKKDQLNQCLAFSYTDTAAVNYGDHLSFNTLRQSNDDLPGSRAEIRSIAAIVDGQYYYGKDANERNFKRQADQYAVLHLALHGEINDENPEHSRLYFTQTKDSVEDNHLYVHELYALNLPSELAVLSACDAGTGKLEKGEGIMSLGRAFQYAGAKSLLLSSWEVSDGVAPDIMKYFYGNLKEGMNKSEALRQAKLQYLKNADVLSANPFYWGNFFIVGDNSPVELESRSNLQYAIYTVLGVVLLLLVLVFFKRKMRETQTN
ncbi:CHAT domain-containing protein [Fulvivirgaceae bacterium BMA10]|uniref:CHAT domain-containing protein n=1 Tax=Splendidivirga corallicola TaxID=3051826 RepID=A0ABT8KXU6_9BACT|nr:CHAT domain-containing protein [Fulvivirgaceae bacterium BMA10]